VVTTYRAKGMALLARWLARAARGRTIADVLAEG